MSGGTVSYEKRFYEWLSTQVTRSQVSDARSAIEELNDYCIRRKLLAKPLLETDDVKILTRVRETIEGSKVFTVVYGRGRKASMVNAIRYYIRFIKTERAKQKEIAENKSTTVEPHEIEESIKPHEDIAFAPLVEENITKEIIVPESEEKLTDELVEEKSSESGESVIANNSISRPDFIEWMKKKKVEPGDIMVILSFVTRFEKRLQSERIIDGDIYQIGSREKLDEVRAFLLTDQNFISQNQLRKNRLADSLDMFSDFYRERLFGETKEIGANVVDEDLKQESELSEIDKLLNEDFYLPLRAALKNENIVTIEELRNLKLWAFMNRNDIYLASERRDVYEAVQNRICDWDEGLIGTVQKESEEESQQNEDILPEQLPSEQEAQEPPMKVNRYTFYNYLLNTVKLSRSTASSYSYAIEECEKFARNNKLSPWRLYLTNPTEAASAVNELGRSKAFDEVNNLQHHRFSAALAKFSEFIGVSSVFVKEKPIEVPVEALRTSSQRTLASQSTRTVGSRQAVQPYDDAVASRVEKLIIDADMDGTTYEQLRDSIGATLSAVKEIVQSNKSIVEVKGKLYHEKAFVDWEDGAKQLCDIIEKLMQRNDGYITSSQLFDCAHIEMHMFLNDNGLDDEEAVYDLGQHLFEKNSFGGHSYAFTGGTHISRGSNAVSSSFDAACKFAEDHDGIFNESDLAEYFRNKGLNTGNIHGIIKIGKEPYFFMYDSDRRIIMSAKSMQINDSWLNQVRDELNRLWNDLGDHVILRELHPMWLERLPRLPKNLPWTPMLLQGVVKFYGDRLGAKTICAMDGQYITALHAMLVKDDSEIQNFGDAVVCYLIENEISQRTFEAEELRRLLIKSKMINGNELIKKMPKALGNDERFAWDASGEHVKIRV